jgi:hypothetical protein
VSARSRRLAWIITLFFATVAPIVTASPRPAHAALDPSRADDDVDKLRRDGQDGFCVDPPKRLSEHAEELCALANDIPRCEGYVTRCAHAEEPPKPPDWSFLKFLGPLAQVLVWVMLAALVVALAVPIVRAIVRMQRDKKVADEPPAEAPRPSAPPPPDVVEETDVDRLLRRAEELKARGDHAHAQFAYLRASLLALDAKGAIRLAPHRTHGEYVRALRDAEAKAALREIVREVDQVKFGGATASPTASDRVAARALSLVRMVLLAFIVAITVGCGSHVGLQRATDPAGGDLLLGLLPAQGITVSRQRGSLATLPMPTENTKAPALLVDLERVVLDDETSAHLMRWVEAGGVLMLAGGPWPSEMGASFRSASTTKLEVPQLDLDTLKEDDLESWTEDDPLAGGGTMKGKVARPVAFVWKGSTPLAYLVDEKAEKTEKSDAMYAAMKLVGKGRIVAIASDDLLTNAALARPGNPGALIAIMWHLHRTELRIARPEEGSSPPSGPFAALSRAGLGLGLVHALVATALLFLAVGVRMVRATPTPPPVRRAFTEHVTATGALYARSRSAPHALSAYARWIDERVRARMPRGTGDPAAWLAQRSKTDPAEAQRIWNAAMTARGDQAPTGDELVILKQLGTLYSAALDER